MSNSKGTDIPLRLKIRNDDRDVFATVWYEGEPYIEIARVNKSSIGPKQGAKFQRWYELVESLFQEAVHAILGGVYGARPEDAPKVKQVACDYAGESEADFESAKGEAALYHLSACYQTEPERERDGSKLKGGPGDSSWADLLSSFAEGVTRGWVDEVNISHDAEGPRLRWRPTDSGIRAIRAYRRRAEGKRKSILDELEEGPETGPDKDRPTPF